MQSAWHLTSSVAVEIRTSSSSLTLSSLQALNGFKLEIDLVQKILKDYTTLTNSGKSIVLCWIPSHVNIPGNERADAAAKSALSLPITGMKLPFL